MDVKLIHLFLLVLIVLTKSNTQRILDPKEYLYKYGYLTSMDDVNEEAMKRATIRFQKSAGIPQTGKMDIKTKTMMLLPRCGGSRIDSAIVQGGDFGVTWTKSSLTFKIQNWTDLFPETQIKKVMTSVIQLWTKDVNLVINESLTNNSDLNIYFKEMDQRSLGYAFCPENGDIYLNAGADLALTPGTSCKIFAGWLFAHELGHALGLDHTETITSIMYPIYNTEALGPSLMDINDLVSLYGGKASLSNNIICQDMLVDAMLYFNNKHILIKGKHYWTFTEQGLESGPYWLPDLIFIPEPGPEQNPIDHFDAGFFSGTYIFMFKENVFYKFLSRRFLRMKAIDSGFKGLPSNMDAILYETSKRTLHVFKGSRYYKYNIKKAVDKRIEVDGNISEYWPGIPDDLESATMLDEKRAFFIKQSKSYVFDMESKTVTENEDFFKCLNRD